MDDNEGVRKAIKAMSDEYSETAINRETLAIIGQFTNAACDHVSIRMEGSMFFASVEGWVWFFGDRLNEDPAIIPLNSKNQRVPWTTDDTLNERYFNITNQGATVHHEKQRFAGAWIAFICVPDLDQKTPRPVPVQVDFCPKCGKRLPGIVRRYDASREDAVTKLMKTLKWSEPDAPTDNS